MADAPGVAVAPPPARASVAQPALPRGSSRNLTVAGADESPATRGASPVSTKESKGPQSKRTGTTASTPNDARSPASAQPGQGQGVKQEDKGARRPSVQWEGDRAKPAPGHPSPGGHASPGGRKLFEVDPGLEEFLRFHSRVESADDKTDKSEGFSRHATQQLLDAMVEEETLPTAQVYVLKNADPNVTERENGNTLLHYCAMHCDLTVAEVALEKLADVNARNKLGRTPLHTACHGDQAAMVAFLLRARADPNSRSAGRLTPLMVAARRQCLKAIDTLYATTKEVSPEALDLFARGGDRDISALEMARGSGSEAAGIILHYLRSMSRATPMLEYAVTEWISEMDEVGLG